MALNPKLKKALKWGGYTLFAIVCYVIFLFYTFPIDVVIEQSLLQLQAKNGISIKADEVSTTILPPGIEMNGVEISRQLPGGKEQRFKLNTLRLSGALWSLSGDVPSFSYYTKGFGGEAEGSVKLDKKKSIMWWKHSAHGINIAQFYAALGYPDSIPISGRLGGEFDITWYSKKPAKSSGVVKIYAEDFSIGPASSPLPIPKMNLGRFDSEIHIINGKFVVSKWTNSGGDIESDIIGTMVFSRGLTSIRYNLLYRFKIINDKLKDDKTFGTLLQIAKPALDRDGYYYYRITGRKPSFEVCAKCAKRWDREQKRYERMVAQAAKKKEPEEEEEAPKPKKKNKRKKR